MLAALLLAHAHAATELHGYFRLMARPDLVGGDGRLGTSAFYGRLLNEGPWSLLDVRQPLVVGGEGAPWGDLRFRIEGGGVAGGEPLNGALLGFRLSQLHIHAGGLGAADVEWRVGTLETTFGDLWLYDARPTQLLVDVLGASAAWTHGATELVIGAGDAGFSLRGPRYHTVASGGAAARIDVGEHGNLGLGAQVWFEPGSADPDALRDTPGLDAAAWYGDLAAWARAHPDARAGQPVAGYAWKVAAHLGVEDLGALRAARLQVVGQRRLPDAPAAAAVDGEEVLLGAASATDARYELLVGAEAELAFGAAEVAWAALLDHRADLDDRTGRGPGGRSGISTVIRGQFPLARAVGLLVESSVARETAPGAATKRTWQGKAGLVLVPAGPGLASRPALRLLYGAQHATVPDSWPGTPTGSRWHQLVSAEAEAWF